MMGHVKMNLEALWVDPVEYQPQLRAAVETLQALPFIASRQMSSPSSS